MRIIIYTHCFQPLPAWMPFYITTCGANPDIQWVILTDRAEPGALTHNVRVRKITIEEMRESIHKITGILPACDGGGYKVCDWRPFFGLMFEDEISGYDYWGHCDLDVFWGNIRKFIPVDTGYDVITGGGPGYCGPFTLYRNNETACNLWRRAPTLMGMLYEPEIQLFEETGVSLVRANSRREMIHAYPPKTATRHADGSVTSGGKEVAFFHFRPYKKLTWDIPVNSAEWVIDKDMLHGT